MNKVEKSMLIVIGAFLVLGVALYIKLFIIGSKSYDNVVIDKVSVSQNSVTISGDITDSSRAYKDFSYNLVGTELYVVVESVLVSNKNNTGNFEIKINTNGININNIYLSDNKSTKVIYSK